MPTLKEYLTALDKLGELTPKEKAGFDALLARGALEAPEERKERFLARRTKFRQQAMEEIAEEVGPLQAFLIGTGKGFYDIGRGLGIIKPAGELERAGIEALKEERPYTTGAGEIVGQAAPFLIPGTATGRIASIPLRLAASGTIGGAEGAIISKAEGKDVLAGTGIGAGVGLGAEIFIPVLGRLGRKIFERVMKKAPAGAMLDATGRPTAELMEALEAAGMTFDDLSQDATDLILSQRPGARAKEVATAARFAEEGIPATKGEITQEFGQRVTEARLLESSQDIAAEPFRQYKLRQSEAIKENLRRNFEFDVETEEVGQLIEDALMGRKTLLRAQKNELYEIATEKAREVGGIPVFTDSLKEAMPDLSTFEDLAITAPQAMKSLDQILTKYGIKEPTQEAIDAGFEAIPLTVENFERFRKTLNMITRGDQTGAASVAIGPIKDALDKELDEMGRVIDATLKPTVKIKPGKLEDGVLFNKEGGPTVRLYHGLPEESRRLKSGSIEGPAYFSPRKEIAEDFAYAEGTTGRVLEVDVPIDELKVDFDLPGGKLLSVEDANDYTGNSDWTILDYIDDGQSVGVEQRFVFDKKKYLPSKPSRPPAIPEDIMKSFKEARSRVRQLKTEFDPKSMIGKIIGKKKGSMESIMEASKIYSKLTAKSLPVEDTRKVIKSLAKSGEKGEQAIASIQASTIMDLIDAGFGTESRQISGIRTFNPIAFKRRLETIGKDKVKAIFGNSPATYRNLENIEKIAKDLIPPATAVPKGSASTILDLTNKLIDVGISTKIPGWALFMGTLKKITDPVKTGKAVREAMRGTPDVQRLVGFIDTTFPGIGMALGTAALISGEEQEKP